MAHGLNTRFGRHSRSEKKDGLDSVVQRAFFCASERWSMARHFVVGSPCPRWLLLVVSAAILAVFLVDEATFVASIETVEISSTRSKESFGGCPPLRLSGNGQNWTNASIAYADEYRNISTWSKNLSDWSHLLGDYGGLAKFVAQQRHLLETKLQQETYGRFYHDLFYEAAANSNSTLGSNENGTLSTNTPVSRGKLTFYNPEYPRSWETLKRRLQIKVLTVQQNILWLREQEKPPSPTSSHGKGFFSWGRSQKTIHAQPKPLKCPSLRNGPVSWVMAVGGHSSAAGHGNFDHEAYISVMGNILQPLWSSLGMRIETRNYGISAKMSVPEMAICQDSILGVDVDVAIWDYAQTDQWRNRWYFSFWMQRASLMANHPILLANDVSDAYGDHILALQQNHTDLPFLPRKDEVVKRMEAAVPDSLGISTSSSDNSTVKFDDIPEMLQYLKCNSDILETNDPCRVKAFRMDVCPKRKWMVKWHPGYRRLALHGTLLALFMIDALEEAIQDLQQLERNETNSSEDFAGATLTRLEKVQMRLNELMHQDKDQVNRMLSTTSHQPDIEKQGETLAELFQGGLDPSWLFHSRSLCRTVRLPSQQRYKGISTGYPVQFKEFIPVGGLEHEEIIEKYGREVYVGANGSTPELALEIDWGYDFDARFSQRHCQKFVTNNDYADFFFVTEQWRQATLPSQAETNEYYAQGKKPQYRGIIILCFLNCKRNNNMCHGDEIFGDGWKNRMDIFVNGLKAEARTNFLSNECTILNHKDGYVFPQASRLGAISSNSTTIKANSNTTEAVKNFDLRIRLKPSKNDQIKVAKITSIVII